MINKITISLITLLLIVSCSPSPKTTSDSKPNQTFRPTIEDYKLGEKWTWNWSRSVNGKVLSSGKDIEEVVDYNGVLGFWNGKNTVTISSRLDKKSSDKPFRNWPLFVGKTWEYLSEWENNEGTKGRTTQDVKVVSYEEVTVKAGTFMAYRIDYLGLVTNSRGFEGSMTDIWWYAPEIKSYIKHVNQDGHGEYINELIEYNKGK